MKVAVLFAVLCLAAFARAESGITLEDMPAFPRLAEVEDKTEVVATGPDNNILNGKPLKVPIIEDPFAQAPGSDAAKTLDRITQVLTMEPPSAAIPKAATDEVDILEVLDAADKGKKADKKKAAKKSDKGKKSEKKGKKAEGKKREKKAGKKAEKKKDLGHIAEVKKEIESLNKLIAQAMKIQADLPKKKARLEELKKKLTEQATKAAAKLAGKKSAAQASLLSSVETKMQVLTHKLQKLSATKNLLHKSINGLKKIAEGKAVSQALIEQVENVEEDQDSTEDDV